MSTDVICLTCKTHYPILAGVLILVPDVEGYLLEHVKGISRYVTDSEIPKPYLKSFLEAKNEIESEHIEEDLEAERVTALYVMTHYLSSKEVCSPSPAIQKVITDYWDHGPFAEIQKWLVPQNDKKSLIELGCGTGGLLPALRKNLSRYLGLDQSFASLVLARHLALGANLPHGISIPYDLLDGPTSKKITPASQSLDFEADFVVCDLNNPPVRPEKWDLSAALNVIDMLPEPESLPQLQSHLLKVGGTAIQSSPYIWHPHVANELKTKTEANTSEDAIRSLYTEHHFLIEKELMHVPWVFYKNYRQIELYSTHLLFAKKI
jgi:SAM-dependent methyltransferase